jgi:hypothetical protein
MDLLLLCPWTVALGSTVGFPIEPRAGVRIANPVSFIAQKLLIRESRDREKQAQDILYIHDTLELFGGELEALREEWHDRLLPELRRATARRVEALCRERFGEVDDVIRSAAHSAGPEPSPGSHPADLRLRA